MQDLNWYLDTAKKRGEFPSDRQLAFALGSKHNTVSAYRRQVAWPSDEAMIRLAELAGIDPGEALLDLNRWRAPGAAAVVYRDLLSRITGAAVIVFLAVFLAPGVSKASPIGLAGPTSILYIMENYVGNGGNA